MKVELDDVLFWMDAIRNSEDRYRTLESFWKGQVRSKTWLIDAINEKTTLEEKTIAIHGGWNGVLAALLFNAEPKIKHITSIDIDPVCEEIAYTVNKRYEIEGKFTAVTADMTTYKSDADIIINTSCEHITQEQYDTWLSLQPSDALFVVQGNNYYELEEHIRCAKEGNEFLDQSKLSPIWRGAIELSKYTRFMIIGKKLDV